MEIETLTEYAPIIVVVAMFLIQQRIIVTPEQLERKHREILADVERKYAQQQNVSDLKEQIADINDKITKIYDVVLKSK